MIKPKIFILSGPSQVGKDAVVRKLLRLPKLNLERIITYTTRPRRPEEQPGKDHFFVAPQEFKKMIQQGALLEWAPVRGYFFGTPKKAVDEALVSGKNVLLKIDVRGARQVLKKFPKAITIFIKPDSLETLKQRMLAKGFSQEQFELRLKETLAELEAARDYNYRIINFQGKLGQTVSLVARIIKQETSIGKTNNCQDS